MKQSLELLGFVKTYHMKELLVKPDDLHHWLSLEKGDSPDWDELYKGYQATVDFPAYPWYQQHLERYPDAKVILTIRPFEKWYRSIQSTIWQAGPQTFPQKIAMLIKLAFNPRLRKVIQCVKLAKKMIFKVHFQGKFEDKETTEKIFNKHIEDVVAYVPTDQLLIYDVSEGWGPLCKFLNVQTPETEFPHLNKKENFKGMLVELMKGKMA